MEPLKHVAIVMDGNGRWAESRNKPRYKGHQEGLHAAKRILKAASDMGIPFVTLYVFSTENNKRQREEVNFLMGLIKKHLRAELNFYAENKIRILHIGNAEGLPSAVQKEIADVKEKTADYTGTTAVLAINYGGQNEIVRAVKKINAAGLTEINESVFSQYLDTKQIPPADLFIRTGGEKRLSNFLLWQSAYAELYFSDKLWPDWTEEDLKYAIQEYSKRNRRFGKEK